MHSQSFEAKGRTNGANDRNRSRGDDRNLHPPPAGELWQAGIIMNADRLSGGPDAPGFGVHPRGLLGGGGPSDTPIPGPGPPPTTGHSSFPTPAGGPPG